MEKILELKFMIISFINEHRKLALRILAGLIVVVTIFVISSVFKSDKIGNTAGNLIMNHGMSAEAGKWTYYIEFDDNEPTGIYKVKTNGTKTVKVKSGYFEYINVIDKYIYCLEKDEEKNQYNLVKMKTNGNKKETLARNIDYGPITASGDRVYYFKDKNLYRVKTNGSNKEKISEKNISYYEVVGKSIYYIYQNDDSSYIATMKTNGKNNTRIGKLDNSKYISLHVKGNKVYYIVFDEERNYKLYKMNKNGMKEERIYSFQGSISNVNMQDKAIYYVSENKISTINYKAGDKETIKKVENIEAITIAEKWIFYSNKQEGDISLERMTINGKKEQSL